MVYLAEWSSTYSAYLGLWAVSLAYLTFDFYPQVSSFVAIWSTGSFWILWIVFTFLDTIAFALLDGAAHGRVEDLIHAPLVATAAIQFLSTVGVYSILQSFTLQFAGKKVVDVEELISRFRGSALQAVGAKKASIERRLAAALADRLRTVYKSDVQALSEDYSAVMSLANMPRDRIVSSIDSYKDSEGARRDALMSELVTRMARADPESVAEILRRRSAT